MLIMFSKVKKMKMEEKERTYLLFVQEPFVQLHPFVQAPFLKKKKENVNYIPKGKKNKNQTKEEKKNELTFLFVQELFVRLRPFV